MTNYDGDDYAHNRLTSDSCCFCFMMLNENTDDDAKWGMMLIKMMNSSMMIDSDDASNASLRRMLNAMIHEDFKNDSHDWSWWSWCLSRWSWAFSRWASSAIGIATAEGTERSWSVWALCVCVCLCSALCVYQPSVLRKTTVYVSSLLSERDDKD